MQRNDMIKWFELEESKKNPLIWYLERKNLLHFFKWWNAFNKMNRFSTNWYMLEWFDKIKFGFQERRCKSKKCLGCRSLYVFENFYSAYCILRKRLVPHQFVNRETIVLLYVFGERYLRERDPYFTDMDNLSMISTVDSTEREFFRYAYMERREICFSLIFFEYFYRFAVSNGKLERFKCFVRQECDSLRFIFRGYFNNRKRVFRLCFLFLFFRNGAYLVLGFG